MSLRKKIHQFFMYLANLFYEEEEEKEVLVMAELTKKLRYRKDNGVTGAITLYSTQSEAGDNRLNLMVDNVNAYAALGEVNDANASHLRVQKGNKTWAVLKSLAKSIINFFDEDIYLDYQGDGDNCYWILDSSNNEIQIIFNYSSSNPIKLDIIEIYFDDPARFFADFDEQPEEIQIQIPGLGIDENVVTTNEGSIFIISGLASKYNITSSDIGRLGDWCRVILNAL